MEVLIKALVVAIFALGGLSIISSVGKERKPISPTLATTAVLIDALAVVAIIYYWN